MNENSFIKYNDLDHLSEKEMLERSQKFLKQIVKRRSVRDFSSKNFPREIIDNAIKAAASAPSGANLQPWHFVIVSDPEIKKDIRNGAEKEEKEFYENRAPDEWLSALKPLGTDQFKPFLEKAPYLIVIFEERYRIDEKGNHIKNYYTKESVGIACGILITALHLSGLATLTHTPSPMNFLNKILGRPQNEKPYLVLVAGYPADDCKIPDISKKNFEEIFSHK